MKLFGWNLERRESSFTDALVAQIVTSASGKSLAVTTATAAFEAGAGLISRAFASAEVSGPEELTQALSPSTLSMMARSIIRQGEIVLAIDVTEGELRLRPCSDWDVRGDYDDSAWTYRLSLPGPSRSRTRTKVSASSVIHIRYATDPAKPWHGYGPVMAAALSGRLSAETVAALADESAGVRATLLEIPVDGEDPTVARLKSDLKSARGATLLVEGQQNAWSGDSAGPKKGWMPSRLGAAPPAGLVDLQKQATREVWAAMGLNASLFESGQGTGAREAWRQALFGVISPLGKIVADELSAKLDATIALDWSELRSSDISGRARAFQSMVGGGMDLAKAASLSGLMMEDDND